MELESERGKRKLVEANRRVTKVQEVQGVIFRGPVGTIQAPAVMVGVTITGLAVIVAVRILVRAVMEVVVEVVGDI